MMNIRSLKKQIFINYNYRKFYSLFWTSILIYSLGYLSSTYSDTFAKLGFFIMFFGLTGIVYSFLKLAKFNFTNKYLRVIFSLYLLWQLYIISGEFRHITIGNLIDDISNPYLFLPYLVPLVILIPANIFFVKKIFDFFTFLAILLFIVALFFFKEVLFLNQNFSEQTVWILGTGAGFLLLTWEYQKHNRKILATLAVLLSLFISTVMARRNIMLTFSNFILFTILIILFNSRKSIYSKIFLISFVLLTTSTVYYTFTNYEDDLFAKITNRIDEDSRDGLFLAFFSNMSSNDLISGKGINGTYYAPDVEAGIEDRNNIECGYLQMILKGGIINLSLFLLIAVPAIYLGLIKSNNLLSKAAGSIIILWLIDMFPWGMPAMNIRYILLWTCIGICYSKDVRNLSETEVGNSLKILIK